MSTQHIENNLSSLRLNWVIYAAGSYLIIFLGATLLAGTQGLFYGLQWLLQTIAIMAVQLIFLWRALTLNHRPEERNLLPRFGPGNWLSLLRGTIIALLSGFLFQSRLTGSWVWLPAILYLISDLTDFLDGYLARASNTVTNLGKSLDMNNDALGVLVATLLAFQFGNVPWWYLPFGCARYLFLVGLYFHRRKGRPEYPLKPSNYRRLFAGIQMGFITVMLIPVLTPPSTTFAATIFLIPFMGMFILDYWQVTGQYSQFAFWSNWNGELFREIFIGWIPLIMRALAAAMLTIHILTFGGVLPPKLISVPLPNPGLFLITNILFAVLIATGVMVRVTAIAALISIGIQMQWLEFSADFALLILALINILFKGGGKYALWNPEEWLIHNRPGQKTTS